MSAAVPRDRVPDALIPSSVTRTPMALRSTY
jgi:hypothetical protein